MRTALEETNARELYRNKLLHFDINYVIKQWSYVFFI